MRVLTLVSQGLGRLPKDTLLRDEHDGRSPRLSLYEQSLNSDILDERYLEQAPWWRRWVYRIVPMFFAQVLEGYIVRKKYDVVVTWSERLGYLFALMLKMTRTRVPHVTLNSWISNSRARPLVKFGHSHVDRILLWSSVQREIAIDELGVPSTKIAFIRKYADQEFFRPIDRETDMISAAGMEGRDYVTLVQALRGLEIPCHLAVGKTRGRLFPSVQALDRITDWPPHVSMGWKNYRELRDLYSRSRFVVVPLTPSETDHGLTSILEAMAMGKAVICSRIRGQVDVIREGRTGLFVPPGDVGALRETIHYLWTHPTVAREMGRAAREELERHYTLEQFISSMRMILSDVVAEQPRRDFAHLGSRVLADENPRSKTDH